MPSSITCTSLPRSLLRRVLWTTFSTSTENGRGSEMAGNSHIEWTDATWNPVTGCTKISPACKHCYAERLAKRLQAMGQRNYVNGFRLTLQPHMLELPLKWKRPNRVFVNSMSDLFHE